MKKNYFRINAKDKIEKKNTKPNKNRQLYQEKFIIK